LLKKNSDESALQTQHFPAEWHVASIEKIANPRDKFSFRGGPFGSDLKSDDYTSVGVRVLQLQDIGEGLFLGKSNIRTSEEKADLLIASNVYPGDILLAKMAPVARCCLVPASEPRYVMCSDGIRLSVDEARFDRLFVFHALNSPAFRKVAESKSTGSTRGRIGLSELKAIELPAPPLPEQQKIAAILTAVDDKLDLIARQISATQTLKQGLMQTLFTRGAGTPDPQGRWHPHTEFQDTELGRIPVGWSVAQLQELGNVIRGASPRPQGDPRYYGGNVPRLMGADVTRDGKWVTPKIDFLTEAGAKLSRPCPKGTLTVICSGDVGIPAFLAVDACIHDGFLALIDIDDHSVSKDYLYHVIFSLKQRLDSSATHGGVFTNLTTSIFKEFQIPLPPLTEQRRIAEALDAMDEKLVTSKTKQTHYQSLKRGLMQKLLTGEWRVRVPACGYNP